MALKADSQGFLIGGEPINLKPETDRLKQIANDVAAMKKAVFSRVGLKDADLKNAATSTANATAKATQKAVTDAIKTAIPRQRDSNGKFVAKTMVVSNVEKIATPKPVHATTKTATPQPRNSGGETMMFQATNKSVVVPKVRSDVASKSIGAVKGLTDRTSEIDPTVKAFQEVAEPLGRGFEFLKGGNRDDKQTGWLKKIFSSLNVFRKEEFKSNKDQKALLQDIDNKTGTGSGGGGLLGGLIAGLGGLLTKIPLIGSGLGGIGKVLGGIGGGSGGMLGGLGGLGKGMMGGAKGLLKKIPFVGALMSGLGAMTDIFSNESDTELSREEKDRKNGSAVGGAAGSVGGMMAGAAIGSMLGPIGTIVGGAVGMFLGDQGGQIIGDVVGGWVNQLRDADIAGTMIKAWEGTTSMIKSGWNSLTSTIEKGWKLISGISDKVVETATDAANATNDYIEEKTGVDVKKTATNAATSLTNMASTAYQHVKQGATKAVETAKSGAEWIGNNTTIGKGAKAAWGEAKNYLSSASDKAGVDAGVVAKIANFESGFNADAAPITKSGKRLSSAHGYGQFIDGTWTDMINKYGSKYGVEGAGKLTKDQASKYRDDKSIQAGLLAEFTRENIEKGRKYGGTNDDANAYAFHNLGDKDAKNLLTGMKNNPSMSVRDALLQGATSDSEKARIEKVISGNKSLYGDGNISASDAYSRMGSVMARGEVFAAEIAKKPENPAIASIMNQPTQPIAAPNIPTVAPVQPIKTPPIPEIAPVTIPLNSMASNTPPPAPVINLDVGQDLSDRNLAHLVTGGLGGRWG